MKFVIRYFYFLIKSYVKKLVFMIKNIKLDIEIKELKKEVKNDVEKSDSLYAHYKSIYESYRADQAEVRDSSESMRHDSGGSAEVDKVSEPVNKKTR